MLVPPPSAARRRMSGPVISAHKLGRVFKVAHNGRKQALHAVSELDLELMPGKTLGVVGDSGCGKTTLNRMLLLLDTPTEGRVLFNGQDCSTLSREARREFRRAVQPVFQNPFSSRDPSMR